MATLVVIDYESELKAEEVRLALLKMQKEYLIDLLDAVVVVNDDARSYFATSAEKFDVIAFGLLDSHTTTAMTKTINCVRRLYQPEALSIALLNQTSMPSCNFPRSVLASSSRISNVLLISESPGKALIAARMSSMFLFLSGLAGSMMSNRASAKVREGM